jgi:hypothetical protein
VHLRDAEPLTDLGLGHVPVEPHHQQTLLSFGQVTPVPPDGLHVERVLKLRIVRAHEVGQVRGIGSI